MTGSRTEREIVAFGESLSRPLSVSTRSSIERAIDSGESGDYLQAMFTQAELDAYFSDPYSSNDEDTHAA